jgi:hypothetical protein
MTLGWDGIVTGYGLFSDVLTESTFRSMPRTGHGRRDPVGSRSSQSILGCSSIENPAPIVDVR